MAVAKSIVTVQHNGVEIESGISRPVRITPDGYAGVAYAGSVYPLQVGELIELGGPSWELADCERFLFAGAAIPYVKAPTVQEVTDDQFNLEWYLETNQFGHYVVFNSTERVAGRFVSALEASGIKVQRWDVSHRQADNGNFYDWFARLRFKGSHADAIAMVGAVVSPPDAGHEPISVPGDPLAVRLAHAEARIEQLIDQVFRATSQLEDTQREVSKLQDLVRVAQTSEESHRQALVLANRHHADLQQQVASLRDHLGSGPDTAELGKELAVAEELRDMALAENAALLDRSRVLEAEANVQRERAMDLGDRVDVLMDRLFELQAIEKERMRAAAAMRPRRGGVVEFVTIAFSRLQLVLDSVEVIANLDSPAAIMRALSRIDAGELLGRDLEGIRGWFEVTNLATGIRGSQRLGRIYYRPDGERVLVNVHIKQDDKQQRRHIERLRNL